MRWEEPKVGQIIWKKKFAFFPKKIGKTKIWLEMYYLKRECSQMLIDEWKYDPISKSTKMISVPYGAPYWKKTTYLSDDENVIKAITPLSKALNE